MATTENIQINITAATDQATKNVEKLSKALESVKSSMTVIADKKGFGIDIPKDAFERIVQISAALEILKKTGKSKQLKINIQIQPDDVFEKLVALKEGLTQVAESLERIQVAKTSIDLRAMFKYVDESVNAVKQQIEGLGKASQTTATHIRKASGFMDKLKNAASAAAGFAKKIGSVLLTPFKGIAKGVGSGIEKITGRIGKLFASIKRIAFYRLLRTMLREITQAFKEGAQNLYQYSTIMGTDFSKSLNKISTAILYVKNSLATIVEPIVNAIAPAIDMISDKFAEWSAKVAEFLANLFGQATYSRAIKYPKQFAEAAGSASKALQKWLAPFDEINRLNAANGGGSSDAMDYSQMFETITVTGSGLVPAFIQQIKQAIETGDFTSIGEALGNNLTKALESINWTNIKKKARKIAASIGTFITGFLTAPGMTVAIGLSIAEMLNTGIDFLDSLADHLDFDKIGKAIGDGINSLLTNFNFKKFIGTIGKWALGLAKFLASAIKTVKWDDVGKKIGEALRDLPWKEIFSTVLDLGTTILDAIFSAIGGAIDGAFNLKDGTGKTIAEVGAVAALAIKFGNLLQKVLPINDAFGEKNQLLKKQSEYTQTETGLVGNLATQFSNSLVPTLAFSSVVGLVVSALSNAKTSTNDATNALKDYQTELKNTYNAADKYKISPGAEQVLSPYAPGGAKNRSPENGTNVYTYKNPGENTTSDYLGKSIAAAALAAMTISLASKGGGTMAFQQLYAGGGFVQSGEAFIARENGAAELVGRIGNRTAVANNQQIVEGVAAGVADANTGVVNAIYGMANMIVAAINRGGSLDFNGLVRQITRVQARQAASANA